MNTILIRSRSGGLDETSTTRRTVPAYVRGLPASRWRSAMGGGRLRAAPPPAVT